MAQRKRPVPAQTASRGGAEDAVAAGLLGLFQWSRENVQAVVAGVAVLTLVVAAAVYYVIQRSDRLDLAAAELEAVQFAALFQGGPQAQDEIRAYIERFSGTPYATEAYLLLGELHLREEQPDLAVTALREIGPSYGTPLHVQAAFLLAVAYEQGERWEEAGALYSELFDRSQFTFQKREAAEGLARAELAAGDLAGAAAAYESILGVLEAGDPARATFEMRLAEVRAQSPT